MTHYLSKGQYVWRIGDISFLVSPLHIWKDTISLGKVISYYEQAPRADSMALFLDRDLMRTRWSNSIKVPKNIIITVQEVRPVIKRYLILCLLLTC